MAPVNPSSSRSIDTVRYSLVEPTEFGVDPPRLEELSTRARREIDEGILPSCQLALARNGRLVHFETIGAADPASRYVIFSMTKGVIAGAIWLLVGRDQLRWSDRVVDLIPEFGSNGKDVITVEQLLTHTSGFPTAPLNPLAGATSEGRVARFEQWRLNWEPGTRFEYHPTSAHWVLAEIIERVSGTDYRQFVNDEIFSPLALNSFHLGEPPENQADINDLVEYGDLPTPDEMEAATGHRIDIADLLGEVTTEALLLFNQPEVRAVGVPGAGGLSNAADIALYYQALLHNRDRLWNPATLAAGIEPIVDLPDPVYGMASHRSRGLIVSGDQKSAPLRGFGHNMSPLAFGHNGAGGQIAWADPATGLSFCYLTNGLDNHVLRQARRSIGLSSRAAGCFASPTR